MFDLLMLIKRNLKLYFKDKGMFFTSLITPLILLLLFATFLAKVYKDSIVNNAPAGLISDSVANALVGGQLLASLLATSCVTIAFCCNLIIVQDKYSGAYKDICITPVNKFKVSLSYFIATLISTLIVAYVALAAGLIYIACNEWLYTFKDVLIIISDVFILSLFGTSLASLINSFLKTQGQAQAVGTIISSLYGFICGAYMPLASFGKGLRNLLTLMPSTHVTCILRNHALSAPLNELLRLGVPKEIITGIKESIDCIIKFNNTSLSMGVLYASIIGTILIVTMIFVFTQVLRKHKAK